MSPFAPFRQWAALPNLAVLHTETTDFRGQVIELALIDAQGQSLFLERIRPTCPVESGAQTFHGISDADLAGLPTIEHHWPRLAELLSTHQVVIYNAEFNVEALERSLDAVMPADWAFSAERGKLLSDSYQPFFQFSETAGCVMNAYAPIFNNRQSFLNHQKPAKFAVACEREKIEVSDLLGINTALGSALRTLRLVQAVAARGDDLQVEVVWSK
ncbi:3'-5' exonuclease [Deinococcus sp. UYEF24]